MIEHGRPVYYRIAERIRDRIDVGELAAGDRIPTETELRESWGAHKATITKAIGLLKSWGYVESRVGSYTRVCARNGAGQPISSPADYSARIVRGEGIYAPGESARVYDTGLLSAEHLGSAVAQAIGLAGPPDPPVVDGSGQAIKRARIMTKDERVRGACTTWIPHALVAQQRDGQEAVQRLLDPERIKGGTGLYLLRFYEKEFTHETTRVGVRGVPTAVALELGVEPHTPMLWVLTTRFADEYVIEADEWFRLDDVTFT